ncbi:MAG: hypothetical protein ABI171_06655 [Collimonas sp.]|uniref:hypothetical protein n=1 Tax=Collimonas sp. TaxID=1963772 RepID=UPI003264CFE2
MTEAVHTVSVAIHDRVTFDSGDGIQVGYVNGLRRDISNGEMHAWIELDHQWPGIFCAVPVSTILTADHVGPPSAMWFGSDCAKEHIELSPMER